MQLARRQGTELTAMLETISGASELRVVETCCKRFVSLRFASFFRGFSMILAIHMRFGEVFGSSEPVGARL